eukprot:365949-Chlamydomonas_euryale.AAC.14
MCTSSEPHGYRHAVASYSSEHCTWSSAAKACAGLLPLAERVSSALGNCCRASSGACVAT